MSGPPARTGSLVILVITGPPLAVGTQITSWFVDSHNEVREFLISRRAKVTPDSSRVAGLRRGPGLRREGVALEAAVADTAHEADRPLPRGCQTRSLTYDERN